MLTSGVCSPPEAAQLNQLGRASWSPDGCRLVFERTVVEIGGNLFTVIGSGGSTRRHLLLPPSPAPDGPGTFRRTDPTFSADGERVVYTKVLWEPPISTPSLVRRTRRKRRPPARRGRHATHVSPTAPGSRTSAPPTGSTRHERIAGADERTRCAAYPSAVARQPEFARLGARRQAARLHRDLPTRRPARRVRRARRRITTPATDWDPKAAETDAAWSPSGKRIAFVREFSSRVDRRTRIAQAIWTFRPDGTRARMIRKPWLGSPEDGKGRVQISWQPLPRR